MIEESQLVGERVRRRIEGGDLVVTRGATTTRRPLADPDDPVFLDLPADGTGLRSEAFDAWAAGVCDALAGGRVFETTYRAPRPIATALAIAGAVVVILLSGLLLWTWAFRPDPAVRVEPGLAEQALFLLAVAIVVGVMVLSWGALVRSWVCRRGGSVRIDGNGIRAGRTGAAEPFSAVRAADYHRLVRCTRIVFADGRDDVWVPAERGALRRLDLLLAAVDDGLGAAVRARL